MMKRRLIAVTALATLLASAGCRSWCEHHGYCPATPAAGYAPNCCCPCGPAVGYAAPAPAWNAPAPPPAAPTCPAGCVVPPGR